MFDIRFGRLAASTSLTAILVALASPSFAAEPVVDPLDQQATTVGEIVVTGRRNVAAIEQERAQIETIDIVETGDISLNSQTNIADLARRLPGVSVGFDQGRNQTATGEAQYATIRGFDTAYNAYTLDGLRLPQTSGGRSISLNLFSPFAVGGINLDKTPGATKDADSIAGTVDLTTPSAFDFNGPMTRFRALGQLAQLAYDRDQDALGGAIGIDAARRFGSNDQFGLYAATYYEKRDNAAESVAVQSEYRPTQGGVGNARQNGDALSGIGIQWNFFNTRIERYGLTTALDYRTADLELFARINYAAYNNTNDMNQSGLRNELTNSIAGVTPVVVQTNPNAGTNPGGNGYNAAGVYTPYGINPANYYRTEDVEQEMFSAQIGGKYHFGSLTASLEAAYADGRFDSPQRIQAGWRAISYIGTPGNTGVAREGLTLDLSNPRSPQPILSAGATAYAADLSGQPQRYIVEGYEYLSEDKSTVKGDLTWTGTGVLNSVAVGGLYEKSNRDGRILDGDDRLFSFRTPTQSGTLYNGAVVVGPTLAQVPGVQLATFMGSAIARPMILVDRDFIQSQIDRYVSIDQPTTLEVNRGLSSGEESRAAAYATATLTFGDLEIVPGLRYEDNSFDARFYLNDADGARFVSSDRQYDHFDPSLLAVWRPNDQIVVRGAARSSYSRPAFNQLAGPTSINRDGGGAIIAISQPNPDLAPVESWNYDLGLEYYGQDGTAFQAAVYHKELENLLVTSINVPTVIGGITYSRPENGLTGTATGIELSGRYSLADVLDGGPLSGFGIGGNVTVQETEADYRVSATETRTGMLPQAPDLIYNAELFYEMGGLRANLWYNYTSKRLAAIQNTQPDVFIQPLSQLNLGVAYSVTQMVEVGVSVRNLLDTETYWTTIGEDKTYIANDRNGGYLETGRVFQISLTANF
ncbi:TonB-dependent receptor [Brevundimonas sp.]|uniref:TonB-dependent receptor n=1 Tax=Brevundimonas sp. TaxID=1871086 RepID=UPI003D0FCBFB